MESRTGGMKEYLNKAYAVAKYWVGNSVSLVEQDDEMCNRADGLANKY